MHSFDFLFGISLGSLILRHSDNLSKSLQHQSMSAAEGQHLAELSVKVLQSLRNSDQFKLFYERVILDQNRFSINPPCLPCKRRAPDRLQVGSTSGDFHTSPEDPYRQLYYEALDLVMQSIKDRFDQPGYLVY